MHNDRAGVPTNPALILAPMAGITDLPFRNLVLSFGTGLVVSEMIASQDMVRARPGTREKAELGLGCDMTAVQLAGRDPYWMGEAARLAEARGAKVIDINMGCPAKKVTGGQSGSALMRELDLARSLIRSVTRAVKVPVTLKCRLGWDEDWLNAPELARIAEGEGVTRLAVHGRTRCQFYRGRADWAAIGRVAQATSMPVIANGDITGTADARRALALSNGAGAMVGRAARGRPWILAEIRAGLAGRAFSPPDDADLAELAAGHYQAMLSFYGSSLGLRSARKHLGWYMDRAGTPAALRHAILTAADPDHVLSLLPAALARPALERAA